MCQKKAITMQMPHKYPACNIPNSTETSLKTSGTKPFGVMRAFLATTINVTFEEESTRPGMTGTPFLLWNTVEVDLWCLVDVWATKATWSKIDNKRNAAGYQKTPEENLHSSDILGHSNMTTIQNSGYSRIKWRFWRFWPSQSPDLNTFEPLRGDLIRAVYVTAQEFKGN